MLPKGVGGGRGPLPALGGGHRPPKAVGAGHGGSVPRRNRLSVRLPVHIGGGRLQCPKVRRGKVGGRVPHLVPPYGVEMESRNCIHKVSVAVSCMCRKVTEEGYSQNALSFIFHNNRVNQLFFVYYK